MEKLNKESLAEEYADMQMGKERDFTKFSLQWHRENSKALYVLKVVENHYSKIIEEKNKEIANLKEICEDYDKNALKSIENNLNGLDLLYKESRALQTAKELLKKALFALGSLRNQNLVKKIEEFLKQ